MDPTDPVALVGDFGLGAEVTSSDPLDADGLAAFMKEQQPAVTAPAPRVWRPDDDAGTITLRFGAQRDLSAEGVAQRVPDLARLLEFRNGINAMKGPFGCVPAVVKRYRERLGGEADRLRLRAQLGFPEGAAWSGVDLARAVEDRSPELRAALERIDRLDGESSNGGFLQGTLAYANLKPDVEGYETIIRGARAMMLQLLNPDCLCMRPDRAVIEAMVGDVDRRVGAHVGALLREAPMRRLERAWRTAHWLAALSPAPRPRVAVVHVPGGATGALTSSLSRAIEATCARRAVLVNEATPDRAALAAWARWAPARGCSVWFDVDDAPDAPLAPGALFACAPRPLLRMPYGMTTLPVKWFNYEEPLDPAEGCALWGSAAAVACALASHRGAAFRAADLSLPEYEYGDPERSVVTRVGPLARDLSEPERLALSERSVGSLHVSGRGEVSFAPPRYA